MIDIHSHILPMIDDGAKTVEQALDMLIAAYKDGTDEIVLTPHHAYEYGFVNPYSKINELYHDLKYILEQEHIPIQIYLGTEFLFSSPDVFEENLEDITKMNNTQYLLMEFFFDVDEKDVLKAIDCVIKHNLIPIIAHPERYECVQTSSSLALQMVEKGALLQMNKSSIFGRYGRYAKDTVFDLLDHHLIHFVGSDAHHPERRTPLMYESYRYIRDYYGKEYALDIFENNAKMMLMNKDIRKKENHEDK